MNVRALLVESMSLAVIGLACSGASAEPTMPVRGGAMEFACIVEGSRVSPGRVHTPYLAASVRLTPTGQSDAMGREVYAFNVAGENMKQLSVPEFVIMKQSGTEGLAFSGQGWTADRLSILVDSKVSSETGADYARSSVTFRIVTRDINSHGNARVIDEQAKEFSLNHCHVEMK